MALVFWPWWARVLIVDSAPRCPVGGWGVVGGGCSSVVPRALTIVFSQVGSSVAVVVLSMVFSAK
ncbi:hypothetical protein [Corynebacterium epidermidicanis]|uniref:hypothetical protein n=1 Tax=Corynebacterium epidermidicanis TaxID=1050174 RepID=UPI0013965C08|nr:hypothetical protein [Corynebacterium epidermidicanis]